MFIICEIKKLVKCNVYEFFGHPGLHHTLPRGAGIYRRGCSSIGARPSKLQRYPSLPRGTGFTGEGVAASEQGCQRRKGALASLEVQGFTEEGVAALEFGHRGHKGNLASLEVQRLMREEATSEQGEMAILFCWQFVLLFVLPALVTFCQFVWGRTFW